MGRQKSLFPGALIGPNSLFCFTLIACSFEICAAHRRSLLLQQAAAQDARTAVHESSGAVRSRKAQCQALPDNPETGDTYHTSSSRERSCAVARKEKIEHQKNVSKRHSHHHPPHDSKQHYYCVELVRVCRLAVVAAAAACCSYCDKENPPPPNEARAIRGEGRRAISAQLEGRVVRTCQSCIFWPRGWGLSMSNYPTCSNESS